MARVTAAMRASWEAWKRGGTCDVCGAAIPGRSREADTYRDGDRFPVLRHRACHVARETAAAVGRD